MILKRNQISGRYLISLLTYRGFAPSSRTTSVYIPELSETQINISVLRVHKAFFRGSQADSKVAPQISSLTLYLWSTAFPNWSNLSSYYFSRLFSSTLPRRRLPEDSHQSFHQQLVGARIFSATDIMRLYTALIQRLQAYHGSLEPDCLDLESNTLFLSHFAKK